ncbi:MAG: hypothetical protein KDD19_21580 [Phaeodactylibacter sp.]|nr:hypothetical protein [Phaeodactylibacter sp.]MCB9047955.1 hypothetical protein [Lewinellaceae bacterium]
MLRPGLLITLLAFLAGWLYPTTITSNCRTRPPFSGYSFISPAILNPELNGAPFFVDFDALERYYERKGNPQIQGNIEEWYERFCEVPRFQDIGVLVYQASSSDLEQLEAAIRSPSVPISYFLRENSFAQYLHRKKCVETVRYLTFAKQCEPFVVRSDAWKDAPNTARQRRQGLIDEGLEAFRRTKSHYIRLRYAYQLIRLAHYNKEYRQVLELYDFLMPKIDNDPSIIEYWIMGHKAGALLALGDRVEAAYLFSRIFENCPSKRESAYRSFSVKTDEEWKACLLRCQNDQERATLYAIRANNPNSKLAVEMNNIYSLAPDSPYLPLLLIQEMKNLEKHLLGVSFNDKRRRNERYYGIPSKDAGKRVIELQRFVSQVLNEGLIDDVVLWRLAEGYLSFLSGNYYDARAAFNQARKVAAKGSFLDEQLRVFELALQISSYQAISDSMENQVAYIRQIEDLYEKYEDFTDFTDDKMYQLYSQNGFVGKAFLFQHKVSELRPNPQPDILDELISVCNKPNRTKLEDQLVAQGDSTFLYQLLDMKATYLMNNYQFEAALETMKMMPRVEWDNYGLYYPFIERINDCVHCKGWPDNISPLNKGELLERLLELEYEAKAGTGNTAWNFYQIGLALYNMSYFSYSWKAMDYYRSGSSLNLANLRDGDEVIDDPRFPYGNREHLDCGQARYYFERARLATDSLNFAAKATFMAAKCERNEYYVNRWREGSVQTFENFNLLLQTYSGTAHFQTFLEECKYFKAYALRQ